MKIQAETQFPGMVQQRADSSAEKIGSGVAPLKSASKPSQTADKVDLSESLTAGSKTEQSMRAKRVEALKSLVKSGSYEISSHEVAKKMLSGALRRGQD